MPWLQDEAALQTHSFIDADPQPVTPPNEKKSHGMSPKLLTPCIIISITTTDPCILHGNAVMFITSEAVSVYIEIKQDYLSILFACNYLCGSA